MSEARLHGTYDFSKVQLIFGTRQITGFENGTEIICERDEDSFIKKTDVDGGVTRGRVNNSSGRVTFSLSQYSEHNKYLQDLNNLDERTGAGVVPLKIVDRQNPSTELVISLEAWIAKPSNKVYGTESGPREWMIDCADLNFV